MKKWTALVTLLLIIFTSHAQIHLGGLGTPASDAPMEPPVSVTISRLSSPDTLVLDLHLDMKPEIHIYSAESLFFRIQTTETSGLGTPQVTLPAPKQYKNFDGSAVDVFTGGQTVSLSFPIRDRQWNVAGYIQYQACDDSKCFLPEKKAFTVTSDDPATFSRTLGVYAEGISGGSGSDDWRGLSEGFRVVGKSGGFQSVDRFSDFLLNPGGTQAVFFAGKSIWVVMVLIVLGGLALNLTPCVLPMMPITDRKSVV